ncbi:MAG: tRNA pseudouridine(55) synthase TruB [Alphaproteobacteria bacterium]
MARRRKGQAVHGWLIVDKEPGVTSTAVVGRARRLLDAAKAGHGGTLDPLATGLLPIAFGEATKTVQFVMDGAKTYRFRIRWGERRDTEDAEGAVLETSDRRPDEAAIRAALPGFLGTIAQVPPRYSAIKVDGERAYDLARAEEAFTLHARPVTVQRLELVGVPDADTAELEVDCGKGFYVRALARDLATALGCLGHVAALRRLRVGPFTERDAISLSDIEALGHSAARLEHVMPVKTALDDIPALAVTDMEAERLRRGQAVQVLRTVDLNTIRDLCDGDLVCALAGDTPIAIARLDFGPQHTAFAARFGPVTQIHPVRVLNL